MRYPCVFARENNLAFFANLPDWPELRFQGTRGPGEAAQLCFHDDRYSCRETKVSVEGNGKQSLNLELSPNGKQETGNAGKESISPPSDLL